MVGYCTDLRSLWPVAMRDLPLSEQILSRNLIFKTDLIKSMGYVLFFRKLWKPTGRLVKKFCPRQSGRGQKYFTSAQG